jgi:septal ring factor EnvC (AmiA/AmiB activator)
MVAETSRRGKQPFPGIRITLTGGARQARPVLTRMRQMAAASGLLCGVLAICALAAGQIRDLRRVADAEQRVVRTEIANVDLQDAVARLQNKLARTASARAALDDRLAALAAEAGRLSDRLATAAAKLKAARDVAAQQPAAAGPAAASPNRVAQLQGALAHVQSDVRALAAENATLAARLNRAQADRAEQDALYRRYEASLRQARHQARRRGGRCCVRLTSGSGTSSTGLRELMEKGAGSASSYVRF